MKMETIKNKTLKVGEYHPEQDYYRFDYGMTVTVNKDSYPHINEMAIRGDTVFFYGLITLSYDLEDIHTLKIE